MQQNKAIKILSWIVVLGAVFFLGFSSGHRGCTEAPVETQTEQKVSAVSVMVDFGNGVIKTFNDVSLSVNASLFDVLKQLETENKIKLTVKDFGGDLGFFVEEIDGIGKDPKGEKWWQFWVNNKYSDKGMSSNVMTKGDVVELKFIKGQQSQ